MNDSTVEALELVRGVIEGDGERVVDTLCDLEPQTLVEYSISLVSILAGHIAAATPSTDAAVAHVRGLQEIHRA